MISPTSYVERLKDKSYPDLIRERDKLIRFMWKYEQDEKAGDRSNPEGGMCPQPVVRYQVYFDYLAAICDLMHRNGPFCSLRKIAAAIPRIRHCIAG